MGKKSTPTPPDLGPMADASLEIAKMNQADSREQRAWAQQQDAANREILNRVLGVQLPVMEQQAGWAAEDRSRYQNMFQPLENSLVTEAQNYNTPQRRSFERGRAMADVSTSFDAARRNALQRLEGFGVDPSQTRNSALDIGVRTQQAAAMAGAGTGADLRTEATSRALRSEGINIGRGYPGQFNQQAALASNAGSQAIGGANATTAGGVNALTSSLGFSGQALQGYGQGANILSQGFGNQMQAYNAQQQANAGMMSGVGSALGMASMLADGGAPRRGISYGEPDEMHPMHEGREGMVDEGPSDGSGIDDQVTAKLSVGEYVIPADVVEQKGKEFFDKLVAKYHTPAAQQRQEMRRALPA